MGLRLSASERTKIPDRFTLNSTHQMPGLNARINPGQNQIL
uniref:Uncharacterized protein n=1 Tax=mine drainage metagenome TaxID=410659 RepID=E6PYQ7_9ZZZZ